MRRWRAHRVLGLMLVGSLAALVGCGTSTKTDNDASTDANGKVTITVNGMPPETDKINRKNFLDDVAAFEKLHPNIHVIPHEGLMDPQTFATKLAGGQLEDVFYVYFTDPAGLIAKHQVADISSELKDFPITQQIQPSLLRIFQDDSGKTYGLPWKNYSMGLVYNRTLFSRAGLNPDQPPTTWDQVREAAKKISALGSGYVGYGDYSKSNTGGWHFTAEMYSLGGDIATRDGDTWKAAFNDDKGKQVLQQLHEMRWTDNSMGKKQLLEYADLLQMMGSGKLGMYVATGDNIPNIVNQYKGNFNDYGLAPMPGGQGTLAGGDGYMFNAKASPAKIKAGLTWLTYQHINPDKIDADNARAVKDKLPVGLPQPNIWTGGAEQKWTAATQKYSNVPSQNYQAFVTGNANIPLKLEPPNAQQIYAVLDTVMQAVLTDRNADIGKLLSTAETQVNSILATVK
jgi:ABC-type glycerol-3-phosphate transport system substrate-binding protein